MSERPKTPDPMADDDATVSEIYREVAVEQTPGRLDRAVLETAAAELHPKYRRLRLWSRPLAWAAVVMLSVALILETGRAPVSDGTVEPAPRDAAHPAATGPGIPAPADGAASSERAPVAEQKAEAFMRKSDSAAADTPESRSRDDATALRQEYEAIAEEIAPAAPPAAASKASARLMDADAAADFEAPLTACDDTARSAPESWLECIIALELAGALDAARDERERLAEAFPDFDAR